jgi:hypothetical protein
MIIFANLPFYTKWGYRAEEFQFLLIDTSQEWRNKYIEVRKYLNCLLLYKQR